MIKIQLFHLFLFDFFVGRRQKRRTEWSVHGSAKINNEKAWKMGYDHRR